MKFNGINMLGKIFTQIVSNISSLVYSSNYTSTLILSQSDGTLYYGDPATSSFRTLTDIPTGSIFLFDSDTATVGYSLLTNVDDMVVYVAAGSGAGAEYTGGGTRGSWTKEAHSHTLNSHTHTSASHTHYFGSHTHSTTSHRHNWIYYAGAGATYSYNSGGSLILLQAYGTTQTNTGPGVNEDGGMDGQAAAGHFWSSYSAPGTTTPQSTTYTGASNGVSGGATGSSSTDTQPASASWRPKGRNLTRQQRV